LIFLKNDTLLQLTLAIHKWGNMLFSTMC
jgi:hypothetical protein